MRISDWSSDVCSSDLYPSASGSEDRLSTTRISNDGYVVLSRMLSTHVRSSSTLSRVGMTRLTSGAGVRSEEHTTELQSLMRISYAVFCLKKKKKSSEYTNTKQDTTQTRLELTTTA